MTLPPEIAAANSDGHRQSKMTVHLDNQSSGLSGLDVAIGLKADLLHRLGTSDPSRWTKHVLRFVTALDRSPLRDSTALVVLLAELREQLRLLLSIEASRGELAGSAPTVSVREAWIALPRRQILARFKEDILGVLLPAALPRASFSPIVQRAKRIIDERYADPLTLERLAAAVGCSKRQLASVFRQQLAMTIHGYLTLVRLRRAVAFIREGEKIDAVSLLVGYQSKKNFYRHFKTHIGVTPRAYRALLFGLSPIRSSPKSGAAAP
jgi:AraC-like DNA-binding protein